jgi:hypothetical protein
MQLIGAGRFHIPNSIHGVFSWGPHRYKSPNKIHKELKKIAFTCGSVVVKALCYKLEGHGFALGSGVYSASDRKEYQKQKIMFLGSRVRPVRRADNLPAIREPLV